MVELGRCFINALGTVLIIGFAEATNGGGSEIFLTAAVRGAASDVCRVRMRQSDMDIDVQKKVRRRERRVPV